MNILVCVKQVPDTAEIKIDPVNNTLIRDGVPSIVNPFDAYALEMAVRLKEKGGGSVTVVCMGPGQAMDALRSCLSVGADNAYLVSDRVFGGSDTLAIGYTLSGAVKYIENDRGPFDLILCGKQAIDGDTGQVGPELAEYLDYAQITYVDNISVSGNLIRASRENDDGHEILEAKLPAVATVIKLPYEPRYASIKSKMKANNTRIPTITSQDMEIELTRIGLKGSPTKVKRTFTPQLKKSGVRIAEETGAQSAAKLASMLVDSNILYIGGQ